MNIMYFDLSIGHFKAKYNLLKLIKRQFTKNNDYIYIKALWPIRPVLTYIVIILANYPDYENESQSYSMVIYKITYWSVIRHSTLI